MTTQSNKLLFCTKLSFIGLGLLVFSICAVGALGAVWVRQQINASAHNAMSLERELTQLQREYAYTKAKIAEHNHPENLKSTPIAQLRQPTPKQIVWVRSVDSSVNPQRAVALRANQSNQLLSDLDH